MHDDYLSDKLSNLEPEQVKELAKYWENPDKYDNLAPDDDIYEPMDALMDDDSGDNWGEPTNERGQDE